MVCVDTSSLRDAPFILETANAQHMSVHTLMVLLYVQGVCQYVEPPVLRMTCFGVLLALKLLSLQATLAKKATGTFAF